MPSTGRDGAPRIDGLDLRWSSAYLFIVTSAMPAIREAIRIALWEILAAAFDQGARAALKARKERKLPVNPFLRGEPGSLRRAGVRKSDRIRT